MGFELFFIIKATPKLNILLIRQYSIYLSHKDITSFTCFIGLI